MAINSNSKNSIEVPVRLGETPESRIRKEVSGKYFTGNLDKSNMKHFAEEKTGENFAQDISTAHNQEINKLAFDLGRDLKSGVRSTSCQQKFNILLSKMSLHDQYIDSSIITAKVTEYRDSESDHSKSTLSLYYTMKDVSGNSQIKSIHIPCSAAEGMKFRDQYHLFHYKKFHVLPLNINYDEYVSAYAKKNGKIPQKFDIETYEHITGNKAADIKPSTEIQPLIESFAPKTHLAVGGGGAKGIGYLGLIAGIDLANIKSVFGTSAGAIFASLVAAGATKLEMLEIISEMTLLKTEYKLQNSKKTEEKDKIKGFLEGKIALILNKRISENDAKYAHNPKWQVLKSHIENKNYRNITFVELELLSEFIPTKHLSVNGSIAVPSQKANIEILFSKEATPNVNVVSAAIASASIPPVFLPEEFDKELLPSGIQKYFAQEQKIKVSDGGFVRNVLVGPAIEYANSTGDDSNSVLAVSLLDKDAIGKVKSRKLEFLEKVINLIFSKHLAHRLNAELYTLFSNKVTHIGLKVGDYGVGTLSFEEAPLKQYLVQQKCYEEISTTLYGPQNDTTPAITAANFEKERQSETNLWVYLHDKLNNEELKKCMDTPLETILLQHNLPAGSGMVSKSFIKKQASLQKYFEKKSQSLKRYLKKKIPAQEKVIDDLDFKKATPAEILKLVAFNKQELDKSSESSMQKNSINLMHNVAKGIAHLTRI